MSTSTFQVKRIRATICLSCAKSRIVTMAIEASILAIYEKILLFNIIERADLFVVMLIVCVVILIVCFGAENNDPHESKHHK
jgi:uncharacterized membrane protein